jgi:hypothetical protein
LRNLALTITACKLPAAVKRGFAMSKVNFDDYWLGYLAGHANPLTRVLHYFGLFFGQLLGLYLSFAFVWWAALLVCPLSYYVAYLSHERVEGNSNKPYATRPLWSVVSFFRMLILDLTGQCAAKWPG